jgi:hypothetical protein
MIGGVVGVGPVLHPAEGAEQGVVEVLRRGGGLVVEGDQGGIEGLIGAGKN